MKRKLRRSAALLAAGSTIVTTLPAEAGNGAQVEGARVRHGHAWFERDGDMLRIRTGGNNTIIDYSRFDIPVGASVEFLQPGHNSRVLNRITSDAPTMIMGSLFSNGRVYFINRSGVVFGNNSRVDVSGIFAAAGNMSNKDFLAGRDRVTGMRGTVQNDGAIHAVNEVVLAGRTVVNNGTIETGNGGLVAMVSGDSVTLQRAGSSVGIRVAGGTAALQDGAGIVQHGTVSAIGGRIVATAGDLASLAVDMDGSVVARSVEIDGGAHGGVRIAGSIDVSGAANGAATGGHVQITGQAVDVASSAHINADGANGGGTVQVGGGMQGGDAGVRNAQTVNVAAGAQVHSDATTQGDGGEIIFWSDNETKFAGTASARGAGTNGRGGFVEVSGKHHLTYDGTADLRGTADGLAGSLLLDPGFLVVQNVAGGADTLGIAGINLALSLGNVIIQNSGASQSSGIQWNATSALAGSNSNSLSLNATGAGAAVTFTAAPSFGTWTGDFNVTTAAGPITIGSAIARPNGGNMNFTAGGGNAVALNAGTLSTTNGNIAINSALTLGANTIVTSGTGDILFASTITGSGGNRNLRINSTGATTFGGSLSSLGTFVMDAGGTASFAGNVSMSGTSVINDAVTLTPGAHTFSNTGGFNTTFFTTLDGPGSLVFNGGSGTMLFNGAVGSNLADLTVNSTGAVTFGSTVNGAMDLVVDTTGTTTFNGALGNLTALNSIDIVTGQTLLSGGYANTTGLQEYGILKLGLLDTDIIASGMTVNGTLSRTGAGLRNLTITSPGTVSILGATSALATLTTDAGGNLFLGSSLTLSGALQVNDNLIVGAPSIALGGSALTLNTVQGGGNSLTLNSGGATTINGNVTGIQNFSTNAVGTFVLNADISATGDVLIRDPMTIAGVGQTRTISTTGLSAIGLSGTVNGPASLVVNAGSGSVAFGAIGGTTALGGLDVNSSGNVNFNGAINGAMALDVDTAGSTLFAGAVGAVTALNSIDVSGPVAMNAGTMRTTGAQDYGAMVLVSNTTLTSTGGSDITMHGNVNGPRALTVNTAGTAVLAGAVGNAIALTSLTVNGDVALNGGTVRTTGNQKYGDATLGADTTLTSTGGGSITMNGTLDGAQTFAAASTGNTIFNGAVGSSTALTSLTALGPVQVNTSSVRTSGLQTYGALSVGANTTLTSLGSGAIWFTNTVNSASGKSLDVNTAGVTTFDGDVTGLSALTTDSAGSNAIHADLTASGDISLGGDSALAGLTRFITSTGGGVSFGGAVDGTSGLIVNSATGTVFDGVVGGSTPLAFLNVFGSTTLNGGAVTTVNSQTYGTLTLGADTTLTSTANSAMFLLGNVDGPHSLLVATNGPTTFGGLVGGGSALSSLTVNGLTAMNGGGVTTTGAQSYLGDTTLGADATLVSTGGGDITLAGMVDGTQALSVQTTGVARFGGAVGSTLALTQLTASGPVEINGGSVLTSGLQLYGNTTLGANTDLTSTGGGNITLGSVTGAGNTLGVHTSGDTQFNGTSSGLASLLADGGGNTLLGGSITASGDINLLDNVMLLLGAHGVTSTAGAVMFGGTVDGPGGLTATSATGTTFTGAVGGAPGLSDLTVNGLAIVNGGAITTTGDLNLLGSSTFGANTALTSGGTLTLGADANAGVFDLSLTGAAIEFASGITVSGQNVTLTGPMHSSGALAFNAAATLDLHGNLRTDGTLDLGNPTLLVLAGSIDSLGDLLFSGAVRVDGNRTVTSRSGGDVTFASTVNGTTFQADTLYVVCSGRTRFNGPVGGTTRMLRLQTDHPGTITVAPFASAVTVIYGELINPTPGPGVLGGGAALAQSYSGTWDGLYALLNDGRKVGMVDYRQQMHTILTSALQSDLTPRGLAGGETPEE